MMTINLEYNVIWTLLYELINMLLLLADDIIISSEDGVDIEGKYFSYLHCVVFM